MATLTQRSDKAIISIRVIALSKVNQRLIFRPTGVVVQEYWPIITPFIRRISSESRNDVIIGLKQLFEDITRLVEDYKNLPELHNPITSEYDRDKAGRVVVSLKRIVNALPLLIKDPNTGLNAVKATYSDKPESNAEISNLIDDCDSMIRDIHLVISDINRRFGFPDQFHQKYSAQPIENKNKSSEGSVEHKRTAPIKLVDGVTESKKKQTSDNSMTPRKITTDNSDDPFNDLIMTGAGTDDEL